MKTDEQVLEEADEVQRSVSETQRAARLHNAVNAIITSWRECIKDPDPQVQIKALADNWFNGKIDTLEANYAIFTETYPDLVARRMRNEV
jgi:hypothetical protein